MNEYVNADEELDTCLTFEDTDEWREELRSMVCDEFESNASPIFQDDESEDAADEPECDPEKSSITSFNNAHMTYYFSWGKMIFRKKLLP